MCRGRSSTSCGRRRRGVRRADRPERTQGVSGQDMKLQSAEHESVVLPAQLRGFLRLDPDLDHHRATVAVGRSGGAGIYQRLLSRYSMSVMNLADVRADGDAIHCVGVCGPSNAAGYTAARTGLPTERQGSVASLSSHEEAHWIGSDDNVGQRGSGLLGFGLASDAQAMEFGAIMMKRTVAWAADNTPRDKVPDKT